MIATEKVLGLRHGCHLFPGPEGSWLIYGPGDEFLRVGADPSLVARVAAALNRPEALAGDEEALALLERFEERGLLAESGPDGDLSGRRVDVCGDGPVAGEVAARLAQAGVGEVAAGPLDFPRESTDLIVACAGWLPDRRFRALDEGCAARRIPWHSCHAEGDRFYLGPIVLPGETASYEDVRARRLSASACPRELEALWRWLEEEEPAAPGPGSAETAALAGALVADVLAVLRGFAPPSAGFQTAFTPSTFTWRRHPVLPVPRVLTAAP